MLQANAFLKKYLLIALLKRSLPLIALISESNVFHKLGAATWKDLSPRVFLVLTNGVSDNSSQVISCPAFFILFKLQI